MIPVPYPFPVDSPETSMVMNRVVDRRADDGNLHYQLDLPPKWRQLAPPKPNGKRRHDFLELARFRSIADSRRRLTVSLSRLPREVNASAWLHLAMQHESRETLNRRDIATPHGSVPDVLTRTEDHVGAVITRTVGFKNADCLFRVEQSEPEATYRDNADVAFITTHSFEPLGDGRQFTAEAIREIDIGNATAFDIPASWQQVPNTWTSLDSLCASCGGLCIETESRFQEHWTGTLVVARAIRFPHSAESMRLQFLAGLRRQKLTFSRVECRTVMVEETAFESGCWVEPDIHSNGQGEYHAAALVLVGSNEVFLIGLLGPSFEAEPEWYSINQRAFEIARDSLSYE